MLLDDAADTTSELQQEPPPTVVQQPSWSSTTLTLLPATTYSMETFSTTPSTTDVVAMTPSTPSSSKPAKSGGSAALRTSIVDSLARQLDPQFALSLSRVLLRFDFVLSLFMFFIFQHLVFFCLCSLARQPSLVDECIAAAKSPNLSGLQLHYFINFTID